MYHWVFNIHKYIIVYGHGTASAFSCNNNYLFEFNVRNK